MVNSIMMKVTETEIDGLKIIDPDCYPDKRGLYLETYRRERYSEIGIGQEFIQDNISKSFAGVFRGLHWQAYPHCQSKLVSVIKGTALDFAVDIRKGSPTFGKWKMVFLSGYTHRQFYIPVGFAHGFLALEDDTIFSYKVDKSWNKESERGLSVFDPELKIGLGKNIILSEKDKKHPFLKNIEPYEI